MRLIIILLFIALFVTVVFIGTLMVMNATGRRQRSDKYFDKKYLSMCKKAQKASKQNKAIAEFYMAEAERYKRLIDSRFEMSQIAKEVIDRAINHMKDGHA